MVQLVVSRALQDPAGDASERDPHVAVPQVAVGNKEHHQQNVAVEQRERLHPGAEGIGHDAEHNSGRKPDQVDERDDLDRMLTQFGERRHHLGRMVDLVELPQRRDLVEEKVAEPIGELVSQELEHGRNGQDGPNGPMRRRARPENMGQAGDDRVAPKEQAEAQHAVSGGENDAVQRLQPHVDERRRMHENAPGENRPQEPLDADAPAARLPAAGVVKRREHECAAERRRAIGRKGTEGF
ncbi:MAG TPA: hypothetical protein VKA12_12230 [Roseiarcus sp.]|nr:hypothetical protein [Roseiarcus sp.]